MDEKNELVVDKKLDSVVTDLIAQGDKVTITTEEDVAQADEVLGKVKSAIKEAEAERDSKVRPHNDRVGVINDFYKKYEAPLKQLESDIKGAMVAYSDKKEEEIKIANAKLLEEQAKMEVRAEKLGIDAPIVAPITEQKVSLGSSSIRKEWKARVVDESLVPREYMIPDEKTLNAVAKSTAGTRKITGVEFYQDKIVGRR